MELYIYDIPEEGLTLKFDSANANDVWFKRIVADAYGSAFGEKSSARLTVTLLRFGEEIDIHGDIKIISNPTCDRCLIEYKDEVTVPIRSHLTPKYESERQKDREESGGAGKELVMEDEEFAYYEGDRIYLDEIVSEILVLAQPMKHLCRENCKGLCQKCGKNLNEGPCGCKEEKTDERWAALKNFKPK